MKDPFDTDEKIEIAREALVRGGTVQTHEEWKNHFGTLWLTRTGAWCFDARGRRCYGDTQADRAAQQGAFPLIYYFCPRRPDHAPPALVGAAVVAAARRLGIVDGQASDGMVQVSLLLQEIEHRAAVGDSLRQHIEQLASEETNGEGYASAHQLRDALAAGPSVPAPRSPFAELFSLAEGVVRAARSLGLQVRGHNPRHALDALLAIARLGFEPARPR
jgi:hypothetical protein